MIENMKGHIEMERLRESARKMERKIKCQRKIGFLSETIILKFTMSLFLRSSRTSQITHATIASSFKKNNSFISCIFNVQIYHVERSMIDGYICFSLVLALRRVWCKYSRSIL